MLDNKQPCISVIVAVFNVECFLNECINSIIQQTFQDLEIILVDDGSTDTSGQICEKFAEIDNRIVVIHQSNAGVSAARNAGLGAAKGKYVAFVDADDVLPKEAYQNLLADKQEDTLIMGAIQLMAEDGALQNSLAFGEKETSQEDFLKDLFLEKKFPYLGYPVDKLYLRELIEKYKLRFAEDVKLNEDRLFVLEYVLHCKKIVFAESVVYYYRQRATGVIRETRRNATVTDSEMTVLNSFERMKQVCQSYSDELYFICSRKAFESALDLLNRVSRKDTEKRKKLTRFLRENSFICLKNPRYKMIDKLKVIVHTILKR